MFVKASDVIYSSLQSPVLDFPEETVHLGNYPSPQKIARKVDFSEPLLVQMHLVFALLIDSRGDAMFRVMFPHLNIRSVDFLDLAHSVSELSLIN